jgi:hypothetical protein
MYDIKQFKPTLYFVVLLGLTGFSMAAESPLLWAFSVIALGVNAWLVRTGRFTPIPRWLANFSTILAVLYVIQRIYHAGGPPLMFIGQFLVFLQIVKLFEQRANRDYAQLIVLSLLLMVAASINTASLLFGTIMAAYLVSSLYCCLLFHLKVETDRARAALAIPEDRLSPGTLRQDQRHLTSSMRRLTGLVTGVSLSLAAAVFLFFPRGAGAGVLGQLQFRPSTALTGFSERVTFEQINRIKQNEELVAQVEVFRDGHRVQGTETLLLRGLTLDVYGGDGARGQGLAKPQWTRSRSPRSDPDREVHDDYMFQAPRPAVGELWRQKVLLRPTGTRFLFALQALVAFKANRSLTIRFLPSDESLQTESIILPIEYEATSLNTPSRPSTAAMLFGQALIPPVESDPDVLAQVRDYTLRPEVTGGLASQRSLFRPIDENNKEIARRIEQHLQQNFSYTLDLTDSKDLFRDADPVVAFLTKVKKGHCEYFASAMTLMCQSLGMPARMVVGFKCDEYNTYGDYYIVKQSHAHTWVEVLTPEGWVQFDPTSGREAVVQRTKGLWGSIKHFFDFLEFKWAEKVVAYENRDRQALLSRLDSMLTTATYATNNFMHDMRDRLQKTLGTPDFWTNALNILIVVVVLMLLTMLGLVVWYLLQLRRLRRRAQRIGLDTLPLHDQLRLARQLAFYDRLTQALSRHRIDRPLHQTPREFADSLLFLPAHAYDTIRRLTQLLYKVRFGDATLDHDKQKRLQRVVDRLSHALDTLSQQPTA